MAYHHLIYRKENHIALITLDNPRKMNAMTAEMLVSFSEAVEAERIGLVTRSVPAQEVLPEAMKLAAKIAGNGPIAMELTKQLIYRGLHESTIGTQIEREHSAMVQGFKTEDYREGATAWWIDKRKPEFKGR